MRWIVVAAAALCLAVTSAAPAHAAEPLASRDLVFAPIGLVEPAPLSFDLVDFRTDERLAATSKRDVEPHTIFVVKQHIGTAIGYDQGVVHGSLGYYVTVAEWGRWNFGVPSPALGFGHYQIYDARRRAAVGKNESTLIISVASVHYRVGYLRSLGVNWYINLEQMYDMRHNLAGSQFGFSFSTK